MDGNRIRRAFYFLLLLIIPGCSAEKHLRRQWTYRTGDMMRGTRFERRIGSILFRGNPVPVGYSVLLCPIGVFVFRPPLPAVSGFFGWVPAVGENPGSTIPSVSPGPRPGSFWYRGGAGGRRPGTPADWVWVRFRGEGYWINPAGLGYFILMRSAGRTNRKPQGD